MKTIQAFWYVMIVDQTGRPDFISELYDNEARARQVADFYASRSAGTGINVRVINTIYDPANQGTRKEATA